MKQFNYQSEIQAVIDTKQLVEIRFVFKPGVFTVAYIFGINDIYITIAEIDPKANLDGVSIYKLADVVSIKTDTPYLAKFARKVTCNAQYQQAHTDIAVITDFSFDGFIAAFENTDTFVEIFGEDSETVAGKIVAHDDTMLVIDEINEGHPEHFSRSYINRDFITRLSIDMPWVNKLVRKL